MDSKCFGIQEREGFAYMGACASPDMIVAVGKSGLITVSKDGVTFDDVNADTNHSILDVAYSPELNLFAACGQGGIILTSSDAEFWEESRPYMQGQANLRGICWGNGRFAAVGADGALVTSTDGKNWKKGRIPWECNYIGFENGLFVAPSQINHVFVSTDLKNWKNITLENIENVKEMDNMYGFAFSNGVWVIGGAHGACYLMNPVSKQIQIIKTGTEAYLYHICWTGKEYVACGNADKSEYGSLIFTSPDGKTWTREYSPRGVDNDGVLKSSLYVNVVFKGNIYFFGARGVILSRPI